MSCENVPTNLSLSNVELQIINIYKNYDTLKYMNKVIFKLKKKSLEKNIIKSDY